MISQGWPHEKQYIDVKDREGAWIVGLVLHRNQNQIKVRFDGWSSRLDETLTVPTQSSKQNKIQPFRTHSRGHTGFRKNVSPRQHWKYTNEDIEARLIKVQEFIANPRSKSSKQLIQFLRGQHYFYIDHLLSTSYHQQQDLTNVYQYFKLHIQFTNAYTQNIIDFGIQQWLTRLTKPITSSEKEQQNQEWNRTYASCFFQIFQGIFNLAGLNERLSNFQKYNEKAIKQIVSQFETHQNYISSLLLSTGAFDTIKNLIMATNKSQSHIPILFVYSLYQLFLSIEKTLLLEKDAHLNTLLECICSITLKSFEQLTVEEVKTSALDKQIEEILFQIKFICNKHHRNELVSGWFDQVRLKYCVLIIKANTIQRKFKGLFKLKEYSFQWLADLKREASPRESALGVRLRKLKVQELLFENNDHAQFFKKSLQFVISLYQYQLIGIDPLVYAWTHFINKQMSLVKSLHEACLQITAFICYQDIPIFLQFLNMVTRYYNENKDSGNNEAIEFYFKFVQTVTTSIEKKKQRHRLLGEVQKITRLLIHSLTQYLFSERRIDSTQLINSYSKTILCSSSYKGFVQQVFNELPHQDHCNTAISILYQVYFQMEPKNFAVPFNYATTILNCLKTVDLNTEQTKNLINLFNRILLAIDEMDHSFELKPQQFKQFWQLFQSMPQSKRNIFYDWIMDANKKLSESISINQVIYLSLKKYILLQVLQEQNFVNFQNLTKRQFSIIIQFYLEVNQSHNKLQLKSYNNEEKVYRLRQVETMKESLLWSVFEKCQNTEVIYMLNKYLIPLHFFYVPQVGYNLRKGRVDDFITKIKEYLHSAFISHNTQMIRHTLMLLKNVIELVKEERYSPDSNHAVIKVQISFQNKTFSLQVKYEDSIGNIKNKFANFRKLDPGSIKLFNLKNEQLSYDVKHIPIYCFSQKYFKVVQIPKQEETMTKFVLSLLSQSLEEVLFKMLQIEEVTQEVYQLLEDLQFKQNRDSVIQRINEIILKLQNPKQSSNKAIYYYYLIQVNQYIKNREDHAFIEESLDTAAFARLIAIFSFPIRFEAHLHLLLALTNLLTYILKNGMKLKFGQQVAQKCLDMIHQIYLFGEKQRIPTNYVTYLQKIVHNGHFIMEEVITQNGMLSFMICKKRHQEMLGLLYFSNYLQEIKITMIQKIKKYLGMYKISTISNTSLEESIFQLYILFYNQLICFFPNKEFKHSKGKVELFATISKILEVISPVTFEQYMKPSKSFYQQVMGFLRVLLQERRPQETFDLMVSGHLTLLKPIIQRRPELKSVETINFILKQCLNDQDNCQPSICRHPSAVEACFQIVKSVLHSNNRPQFLKCIMQALESSHKIMFWRISNKWSIKVHHQPIKAYRGLINPGCVCYMNSLLQQLFMIKQFRQGILGINTRLLQANQTEESSNHEYSFILQAMKELFFKLIYSEQNVVNPVPFARTIKNPQKKHLIKINQQMDIDEFEAILFQKLQKELELLGSNNLIRQMFGGVYSNQIISLECNHRSEREESFISISLEVKKNIYESFKSFVKVDRLDGDNKYFCESCNKKVKAQKIQSIKKLPPYLIICLKRFEFNFQIQAKTKINNYCQFYNKLKLKQFSTQEISRNWMIDQQSESKQVYSDEFFNYKLRGVVIHTGSTDSGHYYSLIDDKAGWLEFNDEEVYPFDISKLPEEAFGNKTLSEDQRVRNAYLLIYQRESISNEGSQHIVAESEELKIMSKEVLRLQQNKRMISHIFQKNSELQKYQLVFSQSYLEFMEFLINKYEQLASNSNEAQLQEDWYDFYLSYYFLILIRKNNFDQFISFSKYLEQSIKKNEIIRRQYLKLFTSCHFIEQFFVFSLNKERSRVVGHLFSTAFMLYVQDTLYISVQTNQLFNYILLPIKMMLIHYGQLYELSMGLRRIFQYLAANHQSHLQFIIEHYSFENIYLDFIFGNVIHAKQKDEFAYLIAQNKKINVIPFIPPTYCTDKKSPSIQNIQTWVILSILLKEANQMASSNDTVNANLTMLISVVSSSTASKNINAISQSLNERGTNHLYLTYKYLKLTNKMCEAIQSGLHDYESLRYRPFMLAIMAILRDPSREIEVGNIVNLLQRVHKHNSKYFLEAELITQWMVRFFVCSRQFLLQFEQRADFIEAVISWLQKTAGPSAQHLKKHKSPQNDKLLNRYYGILISCDANDYKDNQRALKKIYQSVLDQNFKLKGTIHRIDQPLTPGKEVKYFDTDTWKWVEYDCTIVSNNFGYLVVKVGKEKIYLWQDSEKVKVHTHQAEFQIEKEEQNNSSLSYEDSDEEEDL